MRKARNTAEVGAVGKVQMAGAHPRETPEVLGGYRGGCLKEGHIDASF